MSNYLKLAKKIKALADRGVGGEKINAEQMLNALMQKHDISMEQLEEGATDWHEYKIKPTDRLFFMSVVVSVLRNKIKNYKQYKLKFWIESTDAEYLEIEAKFDFFLKVYEKDICIFRRAWFIKNELYNPDAELDMPDFSREELIEQMQALKMTEKIKKTIYQKRLTAPNP